MSGGKHIEHGGDARRQGVRWPIVALLLAAIGYNAILAIVNAHVTSLSVTQVALCEFIVLGGAALVVARGRLTADDAGWLTFLVGTFFGTIFLSLSNGSILVEALRNVSIVALFTALGIRANFQTIRKSFLLAVCVVGAVMVFEISAVAEYSALFKPFSYYQNTRGLGEIDYGDVGLFGNALGFEGRFSFGLFTTPRTSSIFLEQTSLANFASVIAIYLVTMWRSLARGERILIAGFVLLALMSNNTRMASVFAGITLVGYFIYPRLPRYGTLILPLLMLALAVGLSSWMGPSKEDDLAGRIGLSVRLLSMTDFPASLGLRVADASAFPDSGYSYLIYSCSLVGAVAIWLYVALAVPFRSPEQRRCAWSVSLFLFLNLLVAGNAVFSMKIAAPLWLLAGFMRSPVFSPGKPWQRSPAIRPRSLTLEPAT
jgi:hypothetical protein